ncbi:hypothetical protein SAMN06265365_11335 [Tistlia consotensis]|uniref:Uncharacterized protein n=1 Tax=Tistlia consotensis USBA 355 TaxID=560819 RepID=A0A1Y6C9T8_9PROT|nr:hypothetical protein [Tistlia consotensis]SMF41616.1 hypothetical protein SAMN05428998_114110 [Tistlia consotensis USBA 355]SNR73566.1 hypothetical protein SAMN06265365_11335 [Tistlia consotensis]
MPTTTSIQAFGRRAGAGCLAAVTLLCLAAGSARAAGCEEVLGAWKWFTGSTVTFLAGGRIAGSAVNVWRCADPSGPVIVVDWTNGKWIDTLTLSPDGRRLSGRNQIGNSVTAERVGPPPAGFGAAAGGGERLTDVRGFTLILPAGWQARTSSGALERALNPGRPLDALQVGVEQSGRRLSDAELRQVTDGIAAGESALARREAQELERAAGYSVLTTQFRGSGAGRPLRSVVRLLSSDAQVFIVIGMVADDRPDAWRQLLALARSVTPLGLPGGGPAPAPSVTGPAVGPATGPATGSATGPASGPAVGAPDGAAVGPPGGASTPPTAPQ